MNRQEARAMVLSEEGDTTRQITSGVIGGRFGHHFGDQDKLTPEMLGIEQETWDQMGFSEKTEVIRKYRRRSSKPLF